MRSIWKIFARIPSDQINSIDYAAECYRNGVIAVGWSELGDLQRFESREALKGVLKKVWQKNVRGKPQRLAQWAGSLWRFKQEVKPRDLVLCPDRNSGRIYIGKVLSKRVFYSKSTLEGCEFAHRRKVKWYSRTLSNYEIKRIWKDGKFGGRQTVTEVDGQIDEILKLVHRKPSRKPRPSGNAAWRPDQEWGHLAEERAMKWLRAIGKKPVNVARLNRGWDIECGKDKFEVKGRKSAKTTIRFTANEWRAAKTLNKRYALLLITAPTIAKLARATPLQIADPANTEEWTPKATFEYFLNEQ